MKYFRVSYLPLGKQDKEWMVWQATSAEELKKFFNAGMLVKVTEITKDEYDEYRD